MLDQEDPSEERPGTVTIEIRVREETHQLPRSSP